MSKRADLFFELNLSHMGESRYELLKRYAGDHPTKSDNESLARFVSALRETVASRTRTEIRGLGVFFWKPFSTRLPNGRKVSTKRLWFKSSCIKHGKGKKGVGL